ncbi:MAG: MFS transporter [Nitrososphaerota archaeon]|jgi:MFS family permease|nr:MFS transporter [Nitrososphaerota archaeon]MDG7040417.1 MFS transporter [Nitrososphaerota archaeon]MDG7046748.1 MFS transporter [Nitrososphaerota archaeon]MDG7047474.1 MFS transporter [Nitrososphaerota archaeon]
MTANWRKVGLDFGVISGAEWIIIVAAFLGRFLLQFYQTSIGSLGLAFGMSSFEVGIGFALFTVMFAVAAFLMRSFKPSQLRVVEMISLALLGITMPLYTVAYGFLEVYSLMIVDGFITGLVMDSFMTMAGMASMEQSKRQVEQAAFSFWVALALIIAPFVTGYLLDLGIKEIFLIFSVMAFIAIPIVYVLRGKYSLKYMEARGHGGSTSISSLFKNRQFNWAVIAAFAYTIPFYIIFSYGVIYGSVLGLSASTVFYLFAAMFVGDVVTRFIIRLKSPIQNRRPYMVFAVTIALVSAIFLALSSVSIAFFVIAFLIAAIPDGIAWTLGLQIANTTFKPEEIGTSTSFFSSSMMIMSVLMPLVGYMASVSYLGFTTTLWIFAAITAVFFIWELLLRPAKAVQGA